MKFHRSTKVSLKECNPEKLRILRVVLLEYAVVVNRFIDQFWELPELPKKEELLTGPYGAGCKPLGLQDQRDG